MIRAVKRKDRCVGSGRGGWIKRVVGLELRVRVGSENGVSVVENDFGFGIKLGGLQTRRAIRGA
jgi:hypothetical protein